MGAKVGEGKKRGMPRRGLGEKTGTPRQGTFHRRLEYSIRGVMVFLTLVLLALLGFATLVQRRHQQREQQELSATKRQERLASFTRQLDECLERVEVYLYETLSASPEMGELKGTEDEAARYFIKERLAGNLANVVQLNEFVECAFLYLPQEGTFLARSALTGVTMAQIRRVKEHVERIVGENQARPVLGMDGWVCLNLAGDYYLLWMTPVADGYCGSWVRTSYLQDKLLGLLGGEEPPCLVAGDGSVMEGSVTEGGVVEGSVMAGEAPYPLPGRDIPWMRTPEGDFALAAYAGRADLAVGEFVQREALSLPVSWRFEYGLFLVIILVFGGFMFGVMQVFIYNPIHRQMEEISQTSTGWVREDWRLREMAQLGARVNQMLTEIQKLHEEVYDSRIRQRDIQCQYLTIRLKKHFYMNCLTIIHAMARVGRTDFILELAGYLTEYLRFVEDNTSGFVRLGDELEHARNYARIQELRFPGLFEYREEVPVDLYDVTIPPLILQTFLENSVEHGMKQEGKNLVEIRASYQEQGAQGPGIAFTIWDNGKGFSPEALEEFQKDPEVLVTARSRGIGIRNVISRLNLLYQGRASISFRNGEEGGALIQMWIPLEGEEAMEEGREEGGGGEENEREESKRPLEGGSA